MKKLIKSIGICVFVLFLLFEYTQIIKLENVSYASSDNYSETDIQLMARAINGEARGEGYEGQVAVRSSYIK